MTGWVGVGHLLTPRQAAEALAVSVWKVGDLRRTGRLAAVDVGGAWRYHPDDLNAFITTHRSANDGTE